jgi:hypothetical protein
MTNPSLSDGGGGVTCPTHAAGTDASEEAVEIDCRLFCRSTVGSFADQPVGSFADGPSALLPINRRR